jgi:PAS domain S-box-containing protein
VEWKLISFKKPSIDTELFDLWEDNIAIISPDGTIIYTNKSWKQFAQDNGLDPLECSEGTNYLQICNEATGEYSSESSIAGEGIRDIISGKKHIFKLEYPCHGPDEKRWFLLKVTPLSKTYPTDVFIQHIDITERKEAELLAKKKQEQLKKAQSIGNMGSWQFNLNTGTITISDESYRIYGLEIDKIYTIKEVQKIPLPEYRPMLDDALEKLVNGEQKYDVEFKIKRPDDGRILDIHSVAEYDSQNNSVTGIIQDITDSKKSEAQILKNEQELDAIYQNAPVIMMLVDKERRVRKINDSGAKFAGEYPDELIGMRGGEALRCIHHLDDPKGCGFGPFCDECTVRNTIMDTFATGQSHEMVEATLPFLLEGKKKELTFLLSTSLIRFKEEPMVLVSILDITARKESEAKFKNYINNAPDGIFVVDKNGYYVDVNPAACEMTGYSEDELIRMNLLDLLPHDIHEYAINKFEDVNNKGKADIEIPYLTKEGDRRWWRVTAAALSENRVIGFVKDITERNQNLQRISFLTDILRCIRDVNQTIVKESNPDDLLQGICDSLVRYKSYTNVWICLFDENKKINIIKESGFSDKFEEFVHSLKNVGLPYCVQRVLKERDNIILDDPVNECIDCSLKDKEKGTSVFVSKLQYGPKEYGIISLSIPEKYANDEEIISLSKEVVGDISFSLYNLELEATRQKAEESLLEGKIVAEEANRTKSEFLANMSHELRTPLNSVLGFSQILQKNPSNHLDDKELKYVGNIYRSGSHLLELINNILDISKVESGNMDFSPETVNIEEIIDDTIVLVEPMAKKKSIDLHLNIKAEGLEIHVDRLKFKEIMYNLLSNAIKFTPKKGTVSVTSKCVNENVQISVSDTGIGIPEEKHRSIFDPFKQVDSSSNRKYGGTGLGLALVKKYVEMHGGEIWIESEVGVGSTFTFTLPFA